MKYDGDHEKVLSFSLMQTRHAAFGTDVDHETTNTFQVYVNYFP